jgi:toxin ParE1/3/4
MANWLVAPEAQRDLEGIRQYTERNWGTAQAGKYRAQLRTCAARLASDPACGKDLASFRMGLRAVRCQHHYVYCLFDAAHPPVIISVLHERMDLMAKIAERLAK